MTPLKVIAASLAGLLLVPVLVIGAIAGGSGGGSAASQPDLVLPLDASEIGRAVLATPSIELTAAARSDVAAGLIDARILQILLVLAQTHELAPVGPLVTGHSYFVRGTTRVSNHVYGRAVDILGVDGSPVSPTNAAARAVMEDILALAPPLLPDELGGPWLLSNGSLASFIKDHLDHIHVGYDS